MKEIDLGIPMSEKYSCPAPLGGKKGKDKDPDVFPSTFIDGGSELKELPEEGLITFRFRRTSLTTREANGEGPKVSVQLDLKAITDVTDTGDDMTGKSDGREAELDRLAGELGEED
jgi:hypothetical protein